MGSHHANAINNIFDKSFDLSVCQMDEIIALTLIYVILYEISSLNLISFSVKAFIKWRNQVLDFQEPSKTLMVF